MSALRPFHLAFPVDDLAAARTFYVDILGCQTGRSSEHWIDFDFFGHQIVAHLTDRPEPASTNQVDNEDVPIRHFGLVLEKATWMALTTRLTERKISFLIDPQIRFRGQPGEQGTFFVCDPAGNALEFKYFNDSDALFAV